MTKEVLKLALEALYALAAMNHTTQQMKSNTINAIKEALAQPEQEPVAWGFQNTAITGSNRWTMLREEVPADDQYNGALWTPLYTTPPALAQPEKPKYRRGNRLICLETEEYCVIHISGTDRQWVKFPDSHIGVYTNEQVSELFELLPKEPESDELELAAEKSDNYAAFHAGYRFAVAHHLAQPEQEPVAWMNNKDFEPIRVRIMQEAYELADRNDSEGYNAIKVMCGDVQRMLPPQRTWVDLTHEQFAEILCDDRWRCRPELMLLQVQDKLKNKNL